MAHRRLALDYTPEGRPHAYTKSNFKGEVRIELYSGTVSTNMFLRRLHNLSFEHLCREHLASLFAFIAEQYQGNRIIFELSCYHNTGPSLHKKRLKFLQFDHFDLCIHRWDQPLRKNH